MAKAKINNPIETTDIQPNTRVLSNGAVQDLTTGKIIAGAVLDRDRARDMQHIGVLRKREVMLRASNKMVQDRSLIEEFGEYAAVAERAQTLQLLSTTPEAGKAAVMAHQALTSDTGMGERQVQEQGGSAITMSLSSAGLDRLLSLLAGNADVTPMRQDIIDIEPE